MSILTTAQLQALKTDATVTHAATNIGGITLGQAWTNNDSRVLDYYNAASSTPIWRQDIGVDELKESVVWSDFVALTPNGSLKQATYMALTQGVTVNATVQAIRDAIVAIFGNPSTTLTNILAIAKRNGTNFEALVVSAAVQGASIVPKVLYGYRLSQDDVNAAKGA